MFPREICQLIAEYATGWTLLAWVDKKKLCMGGLCANPHPGAVEMIMPRICGSGQIHDAWLRELYGNPHPDIVAMLLENDNMKFYKVATRGGFLCRAGVPRRLWANSHPDIVDLILRAYDDDPHRINWVELSQNPHPKIVELLLKNKQNIALTAYMNPSPDLTDFLVDNVGRMGICDMLFANPNPVAVEHLLSCQMAGRIISNFEMNDLRWRYISENPHPLALAFLSENVSRIDWSALSSNPGIFRLETVRTKQITAILFGM